MYTIPNSFVCWDKHIISLNNGEINGECALLVFMHWTAIFSFHMILSIYKLCSLIIFTTLKGFIFYLFKQLLPRKSPKLFSLYFLVLLLIYYLFFVFFILGNVLSTVGELVFNSSLSGFLLKCLCFQLFQNIDDFT